VCDDAGVAYVGWIVHELYDFFDLFVASHDQVYLPVRMSAIVASENPFMLCLNTVGFAFL
jgi:hypothetical protein